VIPARLLGTREQGGKAEIFLIKRLSLDSWEVLARPGKKLRIGSVIYFGEHLSCQIVETFSDGTKGVRFKWTHSFEESLNLYGQIPLPHYIQRDQEEEEDLERYQTVYATHAGAVAAPTAGLHFSHELLQDLFQKGIKQSRVTLHVGLGTFKPVQSEDIRLHPMHKESFIISSQAAEELNHCFPLNRQICIGTTSCRALESAATEQGKIIPGAYETNIFIYPGYQFKYVKSLLTNFHLPGSTLLMLVCAFGGYDLMMEAYQKAVKDRFRFYSYGDAMLIL
jgi:S-adenosylmethionine:tRNA ribosyltransferase-isomerase